MTTIVQPMRDVGVLNAEMLGFVSNATKHFYLYTMRDFKWDLKF